MPQAISKNDTRNIKQPTGNTPYIIFPGNVGTEGTLCQVVQTLLKK